MKIRQDSHLPLNSYGNLYSISNVNYSDLFHPDNIKNPADGGKVAIALDILWKKFGGAAGLAAGLRSDLKV